MGESLQSMVVKAFKHHANREHQNRLGTPDLFSTTPTAFSHVFRCRVLEGRGVPAGQPVALVCRGNGVQVWCEEFKIGELLPEDAADLLSMCQAERRVANIVFASIEDEVAFDGCCSLILTSNQTHVTIR